MKPIITAFKASPDRGRGLARDMPVRWALEEVGQPYEARLVSLDEMKESAHLARHPFGQIPTYEEEDLALFESGAIVLHIAETHAGLLPKDASARARAVTWLFSALSTIEPVILDLQTAVLLEHDKPWAVERLPLVEGSHPQSVGRIFQASLRCRVARRRVQRRRSDDDRRAAPVDAHPACWRNTQTSQPMWPAAKRGLRSSVRSRRNWRFFF